MIIESLRRSTELLLSLQYVFSRNTCDDIFGDESEHLYKKWLFYNGNLLLFISMIDSVNKEKILCYVFKNIHTD